jgi:hypothetical protein
MRKRWLILLLGLGVGIMCRGQETPPTSRAQGTSPNLGTQRAPPELIKIKTAAEAGDPAAQYEYGNVIPPSRLAEQLDWYYRSARAGYAPAQHALGGYFASISDPKKRAESIRESIRWSSRAAYQGVQDSQLRIAAFYERGEGLPKDRISAYIWRRYATRKNVPSQEVDGHIKQLITEMSSAEIAEAESRLKTFELKPTLKVNPVEADMLFAQLQLGAIYVVNGVRQVVVNNVRFKPGETKELKLTEVPVRVVCMKVDEKGVQLGIVDTPYTRWLKRE